MAEGNSMVIALEPRPPLAHGLQWTGSNQAELAEFIGMSVPEETTGRAEDGPETEGQQVVRLDLNGWGQVTAEDGTVTDYTMPVRRGDYVVRQPSGGLMHFWPETLAAQFRQVTS